MSVAPPVSPPPSLRRRIALAIALTVAFYALAIAIGVALILTPVAVWMATAHTNLWLAAVSVLAGFGVLRAIVPQRIPFVEPGPRLTRAAQPELFALLDDVAQRANDRPVDEVYLTSDVNASVGEHRHRGRVLVLGLPLLQALDTDALRAVVAHEHGHYVGGDTRVGPWIWRTRTTIGRTVGHLRESNSTLQTVVAMPFELYGKLFLRITNAVSRREELAADARAAHVAGSDAQRRALVAVERAALAFVPFVDEDFGPALDAGVRPPLVAGFASFLAVPRVAANLDEVIARRLAEGQGSPYDSHPTLAARLAAIDAEGEIPEPEPDAPRAATLLRDLDGLEAALLDGVGQDGPPRRVAWDEVGESATLPAMRAFGERHGKALQGLSVRDAAAAARNPRPLVEQLFLGDDLPAGEAEHAYANGAVIHLLSAAVSTALADAGWTITALPGEPVTLARGGETLQPLPALSRIQTEDDDPSAWTATCERLAIGDLSLAAPAEPPTNALDVRAAMIAANAS